MSDWQSSSDAVGGGGAHYGGSIQETLAGAARSLLGGGSFLWQGPRNYVELRPGRSQANIFAIRRRVRTEHDFDYYL